MFRFVVLTPYLTEKNKIEITIDTNQLQDVLKVRGFPWPDGKIKGKKKRK